MEKYKEYYILVNSSPFQLSEIVTEKIKKGWEPIGGVSVSHAHQPEQTTNSHRGLQEIYAQAIIKKSQ